MSVSKIVRKVKQVTLTKDDIHAGDLLECTNDGDIVMVCHDHDGAYDNDDEHFTGTILYINDDNVITPSDQLGTVRTMDVSCFVPFTGVVTVEQK